MGNTANEDTFLIFTVLCWLITSWKSQWLHIMFGLSISFIITCLKTDYCQLELDNWIIGTIAAKLIPVHFPEIASSYIPKVNNDVLMYQIRFHNCFKTKFFYPRSNQPKNELNFFYHRIMTDADAARPYCSDSRLPKRKYIQSICGSGSHWRCTRYTC